MPSHKAKEVKRRKSTRTPETELVIITGMSGSGKASVLKAFEDLGYYCVDNLPIELIPRFAEIAQDHSEIEHTALVVGLPERRRLERFPAILRAIKRSRSPNVLFLDASDYALPA